VKKGFTILEVMIVLILFAILVAVIVFVFRTILITWSSQETRAGVDINLDFTVENMVRELRESEVIGYANDNELRFTQGLNDDTEYYIYYFYNSSDTYPPDFSQDTYELRKTTLSGVSGQDLTTGTFDYGDGEIVIIDTISPNAPVTPSALSFRVPEAFYYAIHAGNLYTEHDIDFQNSDGTITGDISASDKVNQEGGMTITGDIDETNDSNTTLPYAAISYYESVADTTTDANMTFTAGGSPYSGIYYIDADAIIESNVTINGSVIVTGSINLQNSDTVVINPTYPYPSLVAGSAINARNMQNSVIGNSLKGGLIYAKTSIDLSQNDTNTFYGTIVAGGNIDLTDCTNIAIAYDSDIQSVSPPYFYYSTITIDLYVERGDEKIGASTQVRTRL